MTSKKRVSSLLKEEAFVKLLSDKHLHQAVNDIILDDPESDGISKIDPVIGDASCQMRIGSLCRERGDRLPQRRRHLG
jgi:hypothetical protein